MASVSRPAALALLSCCLVFAVLLGLTGVAKDSRTTVPSLAHKEARAQGLRSVDERVSRSMQQQLEQEGAAEQRKVVLLEERALIKRARLDQEALEFLTWPGEEEGEEVAPKGLWGPNDDEREELLTNSAEDASDGPAWLEREGGDTEAVFGLDVNNGIYENWDRLVLEMYENESFSFSFEL